MNRETIIPLIFGAVLSILGTCVGWLFGSISTLQHEKDIMSKDIQYIKVDVAENKDGIAHLWEYIDSKEADEKEELKENFKFAMDVLDKQHAIAMEVKDLEIDFLRNGQ